ncbi:MAG: hypothetical protein KTR27_14900 [Leptolyngbyaceae cyanobacterium MAG.088]|nr:hypothetical protein [Leptolyngbyaceae cyanobacterium MAG.088]
MEIKGKEYEVVYDPAVSTVIFAGELALMGMGEYPPIATLLEQSLETAITQKPSQLTLDLRHLKFLNSSGINVISKFVIKVRRAGNVAMTIKGSDSIPWQSKSLVNLKRLMPGMVVELG